MAEFIEGKEQAVNKGDPIIFENKTGSAFDVSVGIVFHESGIYEVSIAEKRTVVSKVMAPTTAPEIIRCKDCKYWIPYDWMFSEVWQSKNIADYPEDEIGCNWCEMSMKANDFCSRGESREVGVCDG